MVQAYVHLHQRGIAHSAEAWLDGELVGGHSGLTMGGVFFGESMFSHADNASKVTFAVLARWPFEQGYVFIDSQVSTDHVSRFGGVEIDRADYLRGLRFALPRMVGRVWPGG